MSTGHQRYPPLGILWQILTKRVIELSTRCGVNKKKIAPMGRGRPGPEGFGGGKGLHSPLFLFSLFYYWHPFLILISFFSDWGGSWNFLVLTETNIYPSGFVLSGFKEFKNKNSYFPSGFIISRFYELMYNSRTIGAITN